MNRFADWNRRHPVLSIEPEWADSFNVFGVFKGTQSGPGPVDPPTGKALAADYVYAMEFDGDRIRHMSKVWNDVRSLRDLGWA